MAHGRARSLRRGLRGLLLAALAVVVLAVAAATLLPRLDPFGTDTRERSSPPLRQSLENLSEYHAATANLQVILDVEQDARLLPGFLKGERTLFVAAGSVDAAVDFGRLSRRPGAIRTSEDRRSVSLLLPPVRLLPPRLDPDRTRVFSRERGLIDRLEDAVGSNPGDEQSLHQLATRRLAAAAAADPELRRTAERNTRSMLTGLLRGLGFERIDVRFEPRRV